MRSMLKKKSKNPTSNQTVDSLRKDVANSVFTKARIKAIALNGRAKRLYHEYRLPTIATGVFLLVLIALGVVRQLEQTSLLALRNEVTNSDDIYATLLTDSEAIEFTRDDTTEQNSTTTATSSSPSISNSTQSTSTPFTFSTGTNTSPTSGDDDTSTGGTTTPGGGSSGSGGDSGGGTTPPPTDPFTASIDSLAQGSTTLQCANPSKPNKGSCAKVYSFSSNVRTLNGPGTVSYAWQSSTSAGNGSGGFSVGAGSAITAVNKEVSMGCNKPASFTIQLALLSPSFTSSNTITVNHNCNEI